MLLCSALLGGITVVGKVAMTEIPPNLFSLLRAGGAALVLWIVAASFARRRAPVRRAKLWKPLALYGLLGVAANQALFLNGLARTTATVAGILVTSIPVFTAALAAVLRVEALSGRRALGVAVGVAGVATMLGAAAADLAAPGVSWTGNLMVVLNSLMYSLYLVFSRRLAGRLDTLDMIRWIFVFGTLFLVPLALPELVRWRPGELSGFAWFGIVYAGVATGVGYAAVLWALPAAGPTLSSLYAYVQPLVAGTLGALFLGDRLTPRDLAGAALIFSGVYLAGTIPRRTYSRYG